MSERTRSTWGLVIDATLVIAAVVAVTIAGLAYFRPHNAAPSQSPSAPPDLVGESLGAVEGTDGLFAPGLPANDPRLLVVFRTDCPFCEASAPTWSRVLPEWTAQVKVIAVATEPREIAAAWLDQFDVPIDSLVVIPSPRDLARAWGIVGVPTLVLVGPEGTVRESETGLTNAVSIATFGAGIRALDGGPDVQGTR